VVNTIRDLLVAALLAVIATMALAVAVPATVLASTPAATVPAMDGSTNAPVGGLHETVVPGQKGTWLVQARCAGIAGEAVSGHAVKFTTTVEFLGTRRVVIGTAISDASGLAELVYRPTWNGRQLIVATTAGASGTEIVSSAIAIDVTGATSPLPAEETQLPLLRAWSLPVGALIVGGVWATLLGLFAAVLIGIRRAGRRPDAVDGPAQNGAGTSHVPSDASKA
jgi:hypothetical protein